MQGELDIVSPMALGGFGAPQFLAANPENKASPVAKVVTSPVAQQKLSVRSCNQN